MNLQEFLDKMNSGEEIEAGSDYHLYMLQLNGCLRKPYRSLHK